MLAYGQVNENWLFYHETQVQRLYCTPDTDTKPALLRRGGADRLTAAPWRAGISHCTAYTVTMIAATSHSVQKIMQIIESCRHSGVGVH